MSSSRPKQPILLISIVLSLLLALSPVLPFVPLQVKEAEAATLHRGDVKQARSEGIVLDADLYTKQPSFNKGMSTSSAPSEDSADTVYTYSYNLRLPTNAYQKLGATITARWDDVGFDADDDRIDLVLSWLPDSQWFATNERPNIPLLRRYDQNGFGTAGVCIGADSKKTGGKICCEQHLKIEFFKHGTATPAHGSFLTKITDLDKSGWDDGYGDRWCESIEFISGHAPHMYVPPTNILNIGKNRHGEDQTDYRARQEMDGSSLDSGVVTCLSSGAEFWYYSTRGWTDILDQFDPHAIHLSSGAGGAVHCKGKTDLVAVGWRGSRTVSIEPETGYKIANVIADGTSMGALSSFAFDEVTSDRSLSASFSPIGYSIRFNANGSSGQMDAMNLVYDETQRLTPLAFTRAGYSFTGWNTKADGSGTGYQDAQEVANLTSSDGDVIDLHALWEPVSYQVAFDSNQGSGSMEDQSFIYDQAQKLSFNRFAREGYLFIGWNTRPDGSGEAYTNEQEVINLAHQNGDTITLYAQWRPIEYYVAFDAYGGTGVMYDQRLTFDQIAALQPNSFKRVGHRWIGWNTNPSVPETWYEDGALVKNLTERAGEVISLYAIWSANRCLVVFDGNGGIGSMEAQSLAYGTAEKLHPNTFERTGYHWVSWNTQPDGSGDAYADEETVQDLNTADNSTLILYAIWEKDEDDEPANPDVLPAPDEPSDPGTSNKPSDADEPTNSDPSDSVDPAEPSDQPTPADPSDSSKAAESDGSGSDLDDPSSAEGHDSYTIQNKTDEDDARQAKNSAPFAKTGESVMGIACLALAILAGGAAFIIVGVRRRKQALERKRQFFRSHLKP